MSFSGIVPLGIGLGRFGLEWKYSNMSFFLFTLKYLLHQDPNIDDLLYNAYNSIRYISTPCQLHTDNVNLNTFNFNRYPSMSGTGGHLELEDINVALFLF